MELPRIEIQNLLFLMILMTLMLKITKISQFIQTLMNTNYFHRVRAYKQVNKSHYAIFKTLKAIKII